MSYEAVQNLVNAVTRLKAFDSAIAKNTGASVTVAIRWPAGTGDPGMDSLVNEWVTQEVQARLPELLSLARTAYLRELRNDFRTVESTLDQLKQLVKGA